jgi:glycosyltransferase involved in cell wall biosynthesis
MSLSIVVATSNSEKYLKKCLGSIAGIADEIVVFDLSSTDDTVEIAKSFGARVINHPHVDYGDKIRDKSIRFAKSNWVLLLDHDEEITSEFSRQITQLIGREGVAAYNIPRKNIFFGVWIAHTNFWPDRQVRLFQKDRVSWPEQIHTYAKVDGRVVDLPANPNLAIQHYGYDNLSQFYDRQNRYSSVQADQLGQTEKFSPFRLIFSVAKTWLARYVKHLGFLDGYTGLFLVYNLMVTEISTSVKLWERSRSG